MNVKPRIAALMLLATLLIAPTVAQQKRQTPARPQPKAAATPAPTPVPTFDTLVPADSYVIYGEVRDAGQLIRSNTLSDLFEPILKLAGPPKEFKSLVKWMNAHADQVTGSRLLLAAWPIKKNLPDTFVAIEFASAEEATKFATPLNEFLPSVLPPTPPEPNSKTGQPKPNFHLERFGSLVVISERPMNLKELHPANSKPIGEDTNFRVARNRFTSEPIFLFLDMKLAKKEEEEQRKVREEAQRKETEQAKQKQKVVTVDQHVPGQTVVTGQFSEQEKAVPPPEEPEEPKEPAVIPAAEPPKEAPTPNVSYALSEVGNALFGGETTLPDGLGLALSFEGDSFDLRALLINSAGERSEVLPFWPRLIAGAAMVPQSPNIFPANVEMFATMSLDLPQIYAEMAKPVVINMARYRTRPPYDMALEPPFKPLEDQLKINLKDDLLPLLGNEVAIGLPMQGLNFLGVGFVGPTVSSAPPKENTQDQQAAAKGPILALAVKDKERLRALMPKLIDAMGFKGASQFAQTERHDDTELVSYANLFAYAFIGDFIVLSSDPATVRNVVDSYLKHETLATDIHFRTSTRWQPQQVQGQFYVSQSLMESYASLAAQPSRAVSEQTRAFLTRLSTVAQPVTYSLSNEGQGPLHEVHIPKNLVLMLIAGISGEVNPPATIQNERMAMGLMYEIARVEEEYKKKKGGGNCGTLEDLFAAELISKDWLEKSGYKFDVTASGDKFEVTAVPLEYGNGGRLSLFIDSTRVLRGGDRSGAAASASDPPIN